MFPNAKEKEYMTKYVQDLLPSIILPLLHNYIKNNLCTIIIVNITKTILFFSVISHYK